MDTLRHELQLAIDKALRHHLAGQFAEAETIYRHVLTVDPENFDALHLWGVLARQTGKPDRAIKLISKALLYNDKEPAAFNNLGVAYQASNRPCEAEGCYRRAIALRPDYAEAHFNLGTVLMKTGQLQEAEMSYRNAIRLKPDYVEAYNNLGSILRELGNPEEAEYAYRKALHLKPSAEIYGNLGSVLREFGKPVQAEMAYREAIALNPGFMEADHNLSLVLLIQGQYKEGFERYEKRLEVGSGRYYQETILSRFRRCQRWQGESPEGKSLLVITEQGIGDNLMMMRYVPLLKHLKLKRLMVCCHHSSLKRLLQTIPGVDDVVSLEEASDAGEFDLYCLGMSLPHLFQTCIDTIPNDAPYLVVPEGMKVPWRIRFEGIQGMKIGLVWAGRDMNYIDTVRSIPLSSFAPLMEIQGIHFVSLQKGEQAQQIKELGWNIADWMDVCTDFLDTAALVDELDLVISVDTAVAHLAGALGKPVWLLNRFAGDWRWLHYRNDSPWYPSMRVFRQNKPGDWDSVIHLLVDELQRL